MTKKIVALCFAITLSFILNGCSRMQCEHCESIDVKYEARFVPSGTREYLCEKCYQKRHGNSNYFSNNLWIIEPL